MSIDKKIFVERLRELLNEAELPRSEGERAEAFGKIFDVNPIVAERIIEGLSMPNDELISDIAEEFEVRPKWLAGEDDENKSE